MLVLTRKYGEVIEIGDSITVTVLGVAGGYARLGIDAPNHIPITRPDAVNRTARVRETIDTTPRHTDDELDLMVAVVRGEPLHQVEQRHDQNDFESDMISAPRARAMARQVETLQRSIDYLRGENAEQLADINRLKNKIAELRALLQNGERVK